eukprot:ANDGO_03876.mRNA.1 General transcription factor IIH subunit 4
MSLLGFIIDLDRGILNELYKSEWVCQAVFRGLSSLSKQFVLRMVMLEDWIPISQLEVIAPSNVHRQVALEQLSSLYILLFSSSANESVAAANVSVLEITSDSLVRVNQLFRVNFLHSVTTPPNPPFGDPVSHVDGAVVDRYAQERWNQVLQSIVGSQTATSDPQDGDAAMPIVENTVGLLVEAGLVVPVGNGVNAAAPSRTFASSSTSFSRASSVNRDYNITNAGFQFLLSDVRTQLWALLKVYVRHLSEESNDLIKLLVELSFLEFSSGYSLQPLNALQVRMFVELADLGLVYIPKDQPGVFFPTKLGLSQILPKNRSASAGASSGAGVSGSLTGIGANQDGFLVVETNFRMYAYTASELQVSLLSLFAEIRYFHPNMVVCDITRDSVRMALQGGIRASQIVGFLEENSHPCMRTPNQEAPCIPETVTDQILLWERERNRIKPISAVAFCDIDRNAFPELVRYAVDKQICVWSSPLHHTGELTLVVQSDAAEEVRSFLRKFSASRL